MWHISVNFCIFHFNHCWLMLYVTCIRALRWIWLNNKCSSLYNIRILLSCRINDSTLFIFLSVLLNFSEAFFWKQFRCALKVFFFFLISPEKFSMSDFKYNLRLLHKSVGWLQPDKPSNQLEQEFKLVKVTVWQLNICCRPHFPLSTKPGCGFILTEKGRVILQR